MSCTANGDRRNFTAQQCAEYGYDTTDTELCWGLADQCPANDWFVPILLALYTLITNVLMLNLLIAMFRYKSIYFCLNWNKNA